MMDLTRLLSLAGLGQQKPVQESQGVDDAIQAYMTGGFEGLGEYLGITDEEASDFYDATAANSGLHPDDDFEEIIDIMCREYFDLDEASTVNGVVQKADDMVWKSTQMSKEEAIAKYGKENVKVGMFKRGTGEEDVQVRVRHGESMGEAQTDEAILSPDEFMKGRDEKRDVPSNMEIFADYKEAEATGDTDPYQYVLDKYSFLTPEKLDMILGDLDESVEEYTLEAVDVKEEEELTEAPTMDTTQLVNLMRNSGLSEEAIQTKLEEWANTPEGVGEVEPTSHGDAYDYAQSVNLSLKKYLDAEDMKVSVNESHTAESLMEAYQAYKGDIEEAEEVDEGLLDFLKPSKFSAEKVKKEIEGPGGAVKWAVRIRQDGKASEFVKQMKDNPDPEIQRLVSMLEESAKPDFADIDDDGDKEESMKKAAKDKEEKEKVDEAKVEEDDVKEGNAFSKALADAKAAGKEEFEVDGKKYKVNESEDLNEADEECEKCGCSPCECDDVKESAEIDRLRRLSGL